MKKFLLLISFAIPFLLSAQELKSPSEFLGYEIGTHFSRHHQVVDYFKYVAEFAKENVQLIEYGKTNEQRPLLLAYISTKSNLKNIEKTRLEHLKSLKNEGSSDKAIVWLSYNVHGNESVSTEVSMQTIYDLLTNKKEYLENTIVIMDPCINPDGRDRYVNWYNQFKNKNLTTNPDSKEHHEGWLNGRSNHYMFDLNRDWAWLTQVESQQRLKFYNKWLPHVHVDFHEQGVDSPYYFAPAAEPYHEAITDFQREFQTTIGKNHAKYFDANGWFYFTKEFFDLLYPSYGDTYPIYNGSIGMTYEQGGSGRAGLAIKTKIGDTLSLIDRFNHHLTTGLSTVEISSKNALKLNSEFKKFYQNKNHKYKSYVLNGNTDKIRALTNLLDQHKIEYGFGKDAILKGHLYAKNKPGSFKSSTNSLVVSTNQAKGTLVNVLFEPNAKLSDSLTYDITAWSLPYAYGLDAIATTSTAARVSLEREATTNTPLDKNAYAYITDWNSISDAKFLASLLKKNIRVRFAQKPFSLDNKNYKRGSLIITKGDNSNNKNFLSTLKTVSNTYQKNIIPTQTGFMDSGKDLGSNSVQMISNAKVAVLSGDPTSTLRFGEIWHFFEEELNYPITILDANYFKRINLSKYDVLILPDGYGYSDFLSEKTLGDIDNWVNNGGNLIVMGKAIKTLAGKKGFDIKKKEEKKDSTANLKAYDKNERERMKDAITGAIFKTKVDTTHPLAYGYSNSYFTLKLGQDAYDYLNKGNVVYLEKNNNTPISGFAGSEAQKRIDKTLIYGVQGKGKGNIIYMVDNPLFRGFWENGKLFFANAIFMVN
ncbi:M14 family metallopeptidase [Maribacter sp.]|uniref:M14 family metallopeptidase n=1 Tax=Maribacter sp. TaxID=1897614 RepID=UPI0025C61F02|nr:M14 family metallopeptidase [Maribacter sp.]